MLSKIIYIFSLQRWINLTYYEEYPLQHLTPVIWLGDRVEKELLFLVIMLYQIKQDSRRLENNKVSSTSINEYGNSAIWVKFNKPGFLLSVGPNIYFLDAGGLGY